MNEELVEALAQRFALLFISSLHEPIVPPDPSGFPSPTFYDMRPVARECLRQIRWAECCHQSPDGGPPPYLCAELAPDDWIAPKYETYNMRTGEESAP